MISKIFPGEHMAFIEEFENGRNTYVVDGSIRSSSFGVTVFDYKRRIIKTEKKRSPLTPKIGDIVIGNIDMLFGSMISIKILFINETFTNAGFSGIASSKISDTQMGGYQSSGRRDRYDRKNRFNFRVGDLIRGRVYSLLNSSIHIIIDEPDLGTIYSSCYNCGGETIRIGNSRIKCIECNTQEEKKLATEYSLKTIKNLIDLSRIK